ncbi:MAG: type I methionyl aminopeptidase [Lachnospiraceae bacterium]|nr:type I methionyl aminopeptidase [Lachnospiraceae bacterium]
MKRLERNAPCWCGSGKKYKVCHAAFDDRLIMFSDRLIPVPDHDIIKTPKDVEGMKRSAVINMAVLDYVSEHIRAGISTAEIDDWVVKITKEMGGHCAPLGYEGYPRSVCTSVNDVVCHGIPDEKEILKDGDIINVDVSTYFEGYFSDSSRMFMIGEVSPEARSLVENVKKCVEIGIENVKPWTTLGDMASKINEFATSCGYEIVREIGGHGIGLEFHEDPFVSYVTRPGEEMLMVPGLCFTIEPMVNAGKHDIYTDRDNGWTVRTKDGSLSAQWEVQLVVTEDGCELICW